LARPVAPAPLGAYIRRMDSPARILQRAFTTKWFFWVTLIGALAADLVTKSWAEAAIKPLGFETVPVIEGFLAWQWAVNEGAAFSILDGRPILLASIALVVLVAILAYAYHASPTRRWFLTALALVASGAIGNLHDRIRFGHVRDFIKFDFELPMHERFAMIPQYWPVFNIADVAILAGVGVLLVISLFPHKEEEKTEDAPSEPQADPATPEAEIVSEVDDDTTDDTPKQEGEHGP
jgi:signal peptidase II